jgi:hypothetical protein
VVVTTAQDAWFVQSSRGAGARNCGERNCRRVDNHGTEAGGVCDKLVRDVTEYMLIKISKVG